LGEAKFTRLTRQIDFEQDPWKQTELLRYPVHFFCCLQGIHTVKQLEKGERLTYLVFLQVSDEMPAATCWEQRYFGLGFLNSALTEKAHTVCDRFAQCCRGVGFGNGNQGGQFGSGAGRFLHGGENVLPDFVQVMMKHVSNVTEGLDFAAGVEFSCFLFQMYIESLKVFCDLARTGSFSKAGEMNHVSQSAVSQQITSLERRLGVSLVARGGRGGVGLTQEGQIFLVACEEILAIYARAESQLRDLRNVIAGELRVAAVHSIGLYELPPRLKAFRQQHPEVRVHVEYRQAAQVYSAVFSGGADLGLVAFPARRPGVHSESIGEDEMLLVCSAQHRFAVKREVDIKELEGEKFVAFSPDQPTRKALDRYFRDRDVKLVPFLEFDDVETVKKAVEVEDAISLVPRKTVGKEIAAGVLVGVEMRSVRIRRPLAVLSRRTAVRSSAVRAFIECLRDLATPA
jgi:DNA-binding transcriptional LysR family regulator